MSDNASESNSRSLKVLEMIRAQVVLPFSLWFARCAKKLTQMDALFPGYSACLETMHGFRPAEAEEDLGIYDLGFGHRYVDPQLFLHCLDAAPASRESPS